jgi:hypothetical protein
VFDELIPFALLNREAHATEMDAMRVVVMVSCVVDRSVLLFDFRYGLQTALPRSV